MFSSPAVHVFSQENADTAPRKPGAITVTRKPFNDRTVNGTSPAKTELKKPEDKTERKDEHDDLFFYDTYSYKDMNDNYSDIIKGLTKKDTLTILRSYCSGLKTPPPKSPSDFNMFLEIPESNFYFQEDSDLEFLEESVEEVSLPNIDFD